MALIERLPAGRSSVGQRGQVESRGASEHPACGAVARMGGSSGSPCQATALTARTYVRLLRIAGRLREGLARVAASTWAPVLLRALGIAALMLGLAVIGAVATLRGWKSSSAEMTVHVSSAASGSVWMAEEAALVASSSAIAPGPSPPRAGRAAAPPPDAAGAAQPGSSPGVTADGRVILNLASSEDLRRLPGVGQKRAEAILALRAKLGRFKRMTDLLRVRGIGPRRLKAMLPKMVLDAPKDEGVAPTAPGAQP